MEDIARECGVTKMTVSRVLAGRTGVRDTTREKVLRAAKRLNYEMNTLAQNLSINRAGFVGVATSFSGLLGSTYFAEVFNGFHDVLSSTALDFALFDTYTDSFNDGAKLARLYRQRKVDGLLVVALHTDDGFMETLEHAGVPLVVVGECAPAPSVCSVYPEDGRGIRLMCEHLYHLGHRRIAFVSGPLNYVSSNRRLAAWQDFCDEWRLGLPADFLQPGGFDMFTGREAGLKLLSKPAGERPTAVVAANDNMAFGVYEAAHQLNLRIPEDVSIAGFDDLPSAADHFPPLTTIHQPAREIGQLAARKILHTISTGEMPMGQVAMEVDLVVRGSTGAAPTDV
jgi:DNA-binding LacI/PurR family transcriptional regulator